MDNEKTPQSEIILYQTEDGRTRIQCRFENETIWLTQALIAELFQKDVRTVNEHLINIFDEGELERDATIRKFRIVRIEGARQVTREVEHYLVVRLREALRWFADPQSRPLLGRRILVTRSREQASALMDLLTDCGAEPQAIPATAVATTRHARGRIPVVRASSTEDFADSRKALVPPSSRPRRRRPEEPPRAPSTRPPRSNRTSGRASCRRSG